MSYTISVAPKLQPRNDIPQHRKDKDKKTLFELDVLRIVGMALIVYSHATPYIGWKARINWLMPHPGGIGLTIFFFLSGFLLKRSLLQRKGRFDIGAFLKSRCIRVLPLYWVALVLFILLFHVAHIFHVYDYSPLAGTFLTHALGVQLFLSPVFPQASTIWYIGALIPYYLLFALTARLKLSKFLVVNLLVLGGFYGLKIVLSQWGVALIDSRLLLHYPTLLLGVCYAAIDTNLRFLKKRKLALFVVFGVMTLAFLQWMGDSNFSLDKLHMHSRHAAYYAYCLISGITVVSFSCLIAPTVQRFSSVVAMLSISSYAIYLFHRPIYAIFYNIVVSELSESVVLRTILFPVATLLLVAISYYIARLDTQVIKPKLSKLLTARNVS